jgi:cardiolipin synthase
MLDPIADKVFIASIGAGLAMTDVIPSSLYAVIIGRDISIILIAFVLRALEKPSDAKFFDSSTTTLTFLPTQLSKVCM